MNIKDNGSIPDDTWPSRIMCQTAGSIGVTDFDGIVGAPRIVLWDIDNKSCM
jgi:hypothetical protein